ncbi:Signal transduction histidine kinase [Sinosporangium album]|uniref:histidine kinase n=1 Tax=Sinosporangium album TaxID=504805 RepID=A0A1G7U7U9_9ACTN|nr:histidine kinase [Sinosporangium album]SDG43487.1 Signal transduction histidine kinase [Sinosporangium album]
MRMRSTQTAWKADRWARALNICLVTVVWLLETLSSLILFELGRQPPRPPSLGLGASLLLCAVGALALLRRRSHPLHVLGVVVAADIARAALVHTDSTLFGPAALVAFYSVGKYTRSKVSWITCAVTMALYIGASALLTYVRTGTVGHVLSFAFGPLLVIVVGQVIRLRLELRRRAARQAADEAVRAERRRIARELHDVVAHHISVISVMVGAARTNMARRPDSAQEALATAESTAREALGEMRQLLNVLRADGTGPDEAPDDPAAAPTAGTAALPDLFTQVRQAGLPVELRVEGDAVPLPSAIDRAVYRIVQEALTNTRKHGGGARATVRLAYTDSSVEVEVLDDGVGVSGGSGGHGLSGMAERVALCGGQLQTGTRESGGFRVMAKIPLPVPQKDKA